MLLIVSKAYFSRSTDFVSKFENGSHGALIFMSTTCCNELFKDVFLVSSFIEKLLGILGEDDTGLDSGFMSSVLLRAADTFL